MKESVRTADRAAWSATAADLRPATWDEALDRAAVGVARRSRAAHGPIRIRNVQLLEGDQRAELPHAEVRACGHRLQQHRQLQPNLTRS